MSGAFPLVPLGSVICQRKAFIQIDDLQAYKRCRVQLHAQGIVLRDIAIGAEIKTKAQQICQAGEFLVAEIDAKVGGYGIVPEELDGAIVSSHYFLFTINECVLDRQYLDFYVRTAMFHDQVAAQGSTNYAAIRPAHVLGYQIPLPPLAEQRRIVARVEALATKIAEACGLRVRTVEEVKALPHSAVRQILCELAAKSTQWKRIPDVAQVNPPRRMGPDISPDLLVSFVPMAAVDDITGRITGAVARTFAEVANGYTSFQDNDVIFARITPCMQNGKSAIASNLTNGRGFGSTEFHVLRPSAVIRTEYLHYLVRSDDFKRDAAIHFKGTAGQQRVPQSFLQQKTIPVPPLDEQQRIVAYLDSVQAKVDAVRRLQTETAAELDALLPAILHRAFRGEL